jgi:small subunit ribosomal protein S5
MRTMNIEQKSELVEKIVAINRVTKVTKGGKKMSFSALVVVGDRKGHVGYSLGKANEVADAIRKGLAAAKKEMRKISVEGTSIPHEVLAEFNAAKVLLKPASEGTGIIACGPVRAVCEAAGIKDILTKSLKSNNPINVIKATMVGFSQLKG